MFVFADKRRFLIGCKKPMWWLLWAALAQSTQIFTEPLVLTGRINTTVSMKLGIRLRWLKHTRQLHLSREFKEVKMKPLLESAVLYQHPLLHQRITQRFIPYRCTSSWKSVLQVGQICFNVCLGFSLLISACVVQMGEAWWEGWLCCRVSPSGDVLDLYPVVVVGCG